MVIGVNLFFLMSGWCRINFRWSKILSLAIKVYIIFGLIQIIGFVLGKVPISAKNILYILDPLDHYWFIMTYILLAFVSKMLNVIVDNWMLPDFKRYVIGFLIACCIYGFFLDKNLHINGGYSLLMAMALYLLGGGLHKYFADIDTKLKSKQNLLFVFIGTAFINSVIIIVLYEYGKAISWNLYSYNNILVIAESISLLLFFASLRRLPNVRIISNLANATIMVYIIHSTCWLTSLRKLPINFMLEKFGFWTALICLPIYAVFIFGLGYLLNIVYEKVANSILHKLNALILDTVKLGIKEK